ncbi:LacI family DNA-binding transcriptional regulator [Flagellimonas algicola]|uniref:LacI family transcriptional regulator n=1 Tax=Flagellimonas algicola TaxID=2583815 RepID=A0ABY2WPW7_9FLAO|nr:LacI family DNA-binding transcriptional regulator [Allomuricauda algicola]TMU57033.1 LacI family transcriptional regulator [Allomuricauda algicola]
MHGLTNKKTFDNKQLTAPMANLKDLARISGFSISTVSKALNNSDEISSLTKKKLRKLATDHNYIPNKTACALRKQKTDILMICLPKQQLCKYSAVIEGIIDKSQSLGYQTLIHQFDLKTLPQALKQLEPQRTVDGLVFLLERTDPATENMFEQHAKEGLVLIKHTKPIAPNCDTKKQRGIGRKLGKALIERIDWKTNAPEQFSKI